MPIGHRDLIDCPNVEDYRSVRERMEMAKSLVLEGLSCWVLFCEANGRHKEDKIALHSSVEKLNVTFSARQIHEISLVTVFAAVAKLSEGQGGNRASLPSIRQALGSQFSDFLQSEIIRRNSYEMSTWTEINIRRITEQRIALRSANLKLRYLLNDPARKSIKDLRDHQIAHRLTGSYWPPMVRHAGRLLFGCSGVWRRYNLAVTGDAYQLGAAVRQYRDEHGRFWKLIEGL